ncbi:uncharacterized protein LOC132611557 [Lycium barbarum]|uniref:uncharacterized protein LOC132611557 n=1 Tax=Lycium barbarum TaxID=112863 RepID=UPI00293E16BC|nr:uncharacterized protein LOC132611557 [Lycium barbarum]
MNWVIWNVRGTNKWYKQKELKNYLKSKHIQLAGFVETRVKEPKAEKIMQHIAPGWKSYNSYLFAENGRVWVLWDEKNLEVSFIKAVAQYIHCHIKSRTDGMECALTVVYGFNTIEQRRSLWADVQTFAQATSMPWIIGGDFNAILTVQDRLYGHPVTAYEIKGFAECVTNATLTELPWRGDFYTWTNKQPASDRIYSRIDRFFGNDEWMWKWGHITTEYDLPNISDHSPMLLHIYQITWSPKLPFKFFNIWTEHADYVATVNRGWTKWTQGGRMKHVWQTLKLLKADFRKLNNEEFKCINQKVAIHREELRAVQNAMRTNTTDRLIQKERY